MSIPEMALEELRQIIAALQAELDTLDKDKAGASGRLVAKRLAMYQDEHTRIQRYIAGEGSL